MRPEDWFGWLDDIAVHEPVVQIEYVVTADLRAGEVEREERPDGVIETSVVLRAPAAIDPPLAQEDRPRRVQARAAWMIAPDRGECEVSISLGFEDDDVRVRVFGEDAGGATACADLVREVAAEGIRFVFDEVTGVAPGGGFAAFSVRIEPDCRYFWCAARP